MELVRDWVLQIAGIIVMGSLCELIMPTGEMKKYVKMVIGLVMVFAVLRPVVNIASSEINIDIPKNVHSEAVELQSRLETTEKRELLRLYRNNLENKILDGITGIQDCIVVVEENADKDFGKIKGVTLIIDGETDSAAIGRIKNTVCEKFGVDADCVRVETG